MRRLPVRFFFFSSRRRHTRCSRDWSSDVCSSDLVLRDMLRLTGTKFGCGVAQCGACTVHIDGAPRRSCVTRVRSEEHTSELQSRLHLVCRLLLEKKKKKKQCSRDVWRISATRSED